MILPKTKSTDILVQDIDNELLIYNLKTNKAYSLNETSALVYQACNGETSFDELKNKYLFTDDLIYLTLDRLMKVGLISDDYQLRFEGFSRREVIKKVGLGSMIALPIVLGITVPEAVNAASACVRVEQCICPLTTPNGVLCGEGENYSNPSVSYSSCNTGCGCRRGTSVCGSLFCVGYCEN